MQCGPDNFFAPEQDVMCASHTKQAAMCILIPIFDQSELSLVLGTVGVGISRWIAIHSPEIHQHRAEERQLDGAATRFRCRQEQEDGFKGGALSLTAEGTRSFHLARRQMVAVDIFCVQHPRFFLAFVEKVEVDSFRL